MDKKTEDLLCDLRMMASGLITSDANSKRIFTQAADAIEEREALRLQCRDHETAVDALRAENAKLRGALEPFARAAEHAEADMTICGLPTDDANEFEVGWGINAGYCIAARAALGGTASRARAREVDGQADGG